MRRRQKTSISHVPDPCELQKYSASSSYPSAPKLHSYTASATRNCE